MKNILLILLIPLVLSSCSLIRGSAPEITAPTPAPVTESPADEMMRSHCQMMPEMVGCEKYRNTSDTSSGSKKMSLNTLILTEDETVTDANPTTVVDLRDGDTYDLTIQKVRKVIDGKSLIMLSYNGSIPGPTFRVASGATVKFHVRNTVKELATTVHPHGIRLNYRYDGVPRDQGGSQDPLRVGDTYEQIITFPDTGLMWYHPHTRDDFEQELGEYGAFLVYDPQEAKRWDSESVITLDDILITDGAIPPFDSEGANHTLMGRYGNTMFVNGETAFSLTMKQGEVKRLYLVNTANARPFDLAIPGVKMKLVGSDMGYYQTERYIDHLVIAPAERYIVDIIAPPAGSYPIESIGGGKTLSLGKLTVTPSTSVSARRDAFETLGSHDILSTLSGTLRTHQDRSPDKRLLITMSMPGMEGMDHQMGGMMPMGQESPDGIEWEDTMAMMNRQSTDASVKWILRDEATGKEGMDIDWRYQQGSLVKIRITNDGSSMHPMQHPFHMHGQRFLILSRDGQHETDLVWKDTVLIPRGQYVDLLVDMSNPGNWMAHCHIVEHLFSGMMFHYRVEEK